MASNEAALSGNIRKFEVKSKDISQISPEIKYYENVLSNTISATAVVADAGGLEPDQKEMIGVLDGLPIRGGEFVKLIIEDNQSKPNKLDLDLYVNRVKNSSPGTSNDVYFLDFCTKEFIANEQSRVVKRFELNISDAIRKILTDPKGLQVKKKLDIDETAVPYNFIGNDRKPLYVCTWLASKAVPKAAGGINGAAGYFMYETSDSFKFKSIDVLVKQEPKKKYIYTNATKLPDGYDGKILNVKIDRNIDLQQNMSLGMYHNRSIFFDFYAMDYQVRTYSLEQDQKSKIEIAADNIMFVDKEFTQIPTRFLNHVLDLGTLPSGKNAKEQLKNWKAKPTDPNFDAPKTMVQSIMRYNQLYSIKTHIMIPGDFSLHAGDMIECDFPDLARVENRQPNKQTKGKYMIASLCHRITPKDCFTSLTLVRDSFSGKVS
jgi:hypothetical protein